MAKAALKLRRLLVRAQDANCTDEVSRQKFRERKEVSIRKERFSQPDADNT